jgi:hypothetical protein
MARTSIKHSSKTAGAGGIGSMRPTIPSLRHWRRRRERRRKACGWILSSYRRGSGGRSRRKQRHGALETQKKVDPPRICQVVAFLRVQ